MVTGRASRRRRSETCPIRSRKPPSPGFGGGIPVMSFGDLGPQGPLEDLRPGRVDVVKHAVRVPRDRALEVLVASEMLDLELPVLKLGLFNLNRPRYRVRSA